MAKTKELLRRELEAALRMAPRRLSLLEAERRSAYPIGIPRDHAWVSMRVVGCADGSADVVLQAEDRRRIIGSDGSGRAPVVYEPVTRRMSVPADRLAALINALTTLAYAREVEWLAEALRLAEEAVQRTRAHAAEELLDWLLERHLPPGEPLRQRIRRSAWLDARGALAAVREQLPDAAEQVTDHLLAARWSDALDALEDALDELDRRAAGEVPE